MESESTVVRSFYSVPILKMVLLCNITIIIRSIILNYNTFALRLHVYLPHKRSCFLLHKQNALLLFILCRHFVGYSGVFKMSSTSKTAPIHKTQTQYQVMHGFLKESNSQQNRTTDSGTVSTPSLLCFECVPTFWKVFLQ